MISTIIVKSILQETIMPPDIIDKIIEKYKILVYEKITYFEKKYKILAQEHLRIYTTALSSLQFTDKFRKDSNHISDEIRYCRKILKKIYNDTITL